MKYTSKLILNGEEYQFAAPSGGWQPGANTVAYWKLNGNLTDEMGSYDGTNLSATINYVSLPGDSSVKCAEVYSDDWNRGISLPTTINSEILSSNIDFTFGGFIKATFSNAHEFLYLEGSGPSLICLSIRDNDVFYEILPNSNGFITINLVNDTWNSIVYSYKSSTKTLSIYINGVFVGDKTFNQDYTLLGTVTEAYLARMNNYTLMSNFFLEKNIAWDSTQTQFFHDTFKSLYGIS